MKRKTFLKALLSFSILPLFGRKKEVEINTPSMSLSSYNRLKDMQRQDIKFDTEEEWDGLGFPDNRDAISFKHKAKIVNGDWYSTGEWHEYVSYWEDGKRKTFMDGIEQTNTASVDFKDVWI